MKKPPVELTGISAKTLRTKVLKCVDLFCGAGGFRESYKFTGTKTAIVRQIGNAVPRRLAGAIAAAAFTQNPDAPEAICLWEENQTHPNKIEEVAA
jgi:hypothetical protein